MGRAKGRPNNQTIRTVVAYLEGLGLNVYGQCMDIDAGILYGGCMDFDIEDILKLAKADQSTFTYYEDRL